MLDNIWTFLKDPANQAVITWFSGGVVVVASGIWAVVKFFARKGEGEEVKPTLRAEGGSVVVGGDNKNSPINIGAKGRSKR